MWVGGYTLDLYCDNRSDPVYHSVYDEFPKQYYHEHGCVCRHNARKAGWIISATKTLCPKCSGKKIGV